MDTFTALENYRLREKIEELFAVNKGGLMAHGRAHGIPTICGEDNLCSLSHWDTIVFWRRK